MVKHVVIMAGGSGTRLWPASKASFPKQFLDLGTGQSLFQTTLERASALGHDGMTIVVTHASHVPEIVRQWRSLGVPPETAPKAVILPEPVARNTAPALAYAAAFLEDRGESEATFIALASDHLIEPLSRFREDVEKAHRLADSGFLVAFGIAPAGPETGYGYIEIGAAREPGYKIKRFHEKPDLETAQGYLREGNYFWNSGMFTYRVDRFLEGLRKNSPNAVSPFSRLSITLTSEDAIGLPRDMGAIEAVYDELPSISIDYALMEKSGNAAMVPASFDWSDVGSWDEVTKRFDQPQADVLDVSSSGNFVLSDIPVALAGVSDLIVVIKNGVALICRKGSSQLVRELVQKARDRERTELL